MAHHHLLQPRLLNPCRTTHNNQTGRGGGTSLRRMGRGRGWSGDAADALVRRGRPSSPPRQSWRLSSALFCQPRRVAGEEGGDGRAGEKV